MLWINHPFSAADYTADQGSWTVQASDVHIYRYAVEDDVLWVRWAANDTVITGSPKVLILRTPSTVPAPLQRQGPLLMSAFLHGPLPHRACYIESEIGQQHILIKRITDEPFLNVGLGGGFCVFFPLT